MAKKNGIKNAVENASREVKAAANKAVKNAAKGAVKGATAGTKKATQPTLSKRPKISKTPYRGGAKASTMPKKGNDKPKIKYV